MYWFLVKEPTGQGGYSPKPLILEVLFVRKKEVLVLYVMKM